MKTLLVLPVPAYAFLVVAVATARRGNRSSERRDSATLQALFYCLQSIYGGLRGATERLTGVLSGQVSTPVLVRHFRCGKRNGGLLILKGAAS
jgi:heme A synthase